MEVLSSSSSVTGVAPDSISTLLNEYAALSNDYTLQAARKQVTDNLISGNLAIEQVASLSSSSSLREAFLSKTRDLANEVSNLQDVCLAIDDNDDAGIEAQLRAEIEKGELLVKKLMDEQLTVEKTIADTRRHIDDLNNSDEFDSKENQAPDDRSQSMTVLNTDTTKLRAVQKLHKESNALFAGLSTLTGMKEFHVSESLEDGEGAVMITATIGKCTVEVVLGAEDQRIIAIEVKAGDLPMRLEKLLDDSRVLPSPQDLRYAVFAIGAAQLARDAAMKDIATVKALRTCLVQMLASDDSSLLRFQLELKGRIVATIAVHECYPEVPGGVTVQSLVGPDDPSPQGEGGALLSEARNATNAGCFRTLPDMYAFMMGPKALGKMEL